MSKNRDDAVTILASGGAGAATGYHVGKLISHIANKKKLISAPYDAPLKIFSASMGFNAGALSARKYLEHKNEMNNKYLDKVAFTNIVGGYQGASKGDKLGGTLVGTGLGTVTSVIGGAIGAKSGRVTPMLAGSFGGAYLGGLAGGKLYSKAKKALKD